MVGYREAQVAFVRRCLVAAGGITATELARRAGLAPSTLNKLLAEPDADNSTRLLSYRTLVKMAEVAGLESALNLGGPASGEERELLEIYESLPRDQREAIVRFLEAWLRKA